MNIIPYYPELRDSFEEMLVTYFIDDLKSDIPEDIVRGKLLDLITGDVQKGFYHMAILLDEHNPIGFSIYQIDAPECGWCKRPGWGFIREFYIQKEYRQRGHGGKLAAFTEDHLRRLGAAQFYLTSDGAIGFWEKCGWTNTHELCTNDLEILVK